MGDIIAVELSRISAALHELQSGADDVRYGQLWVAQQALNWAANPALFASPFNAISDGKVWTPNDFQAMKVDSDKS